MKKIKQIFAFCGKDGWTIDGPLNDFIKTLPKKGDEIMKITYITDTKVGDVRAAVVEFEE